MIFYLLKSMIFVGGSGALKLASELCTWNFNWLLIILCPVYTHLLIDTSTVIDSQLARIHSAKIFLHALHA